MAPGWPRWLGTFRTRCTRCVTGTLRTLQRGRYLVAIEEPAPGRKPRARLDELDPVADAVLRRLDIDYYVSWHSALWHHGLIDQQSRRVYVAVTQRKRPVTLGMADVRFVSMTERKFFGRARIDDFEWPVWMATVEKAVIDSLDQPRLAAPLPVVTHALKRAYRDEMLDPDRLVAEAIRFGRPDAEPPTRVFHGPLRHPGQYAAEGAPWAKVRRPAGPGGEPVGEIPRSIASGGCMRTRRSSERPWS